MNTPVLVTPDRRIADESALVLLAEGVRASVEGSSDGYSLKVPASDVERALSILDLYASENPPPEEAEPPHHHPSAFRAAGVVMAALLFFFLVTGARDPSVHWFARGSADAERIVAGELWRTVTALTLHADLGHVLGNAFAGALFLTSLGHTLGPGLAVALALVAGAGGNLVNATLHGTAHSVVGASTAVFGAVGLLVGHGLVRRGRGGARGYRLWTPFAAGLALLAMLGTGARADVGAHLLGLLVGASLGVLVALTLRRVPSSAAQWAFGVAALLAVLYSWGMALD